MATKGYNLEQTGEQVQEALNKVINLVPATVDTAGLMSAADKEKLNSLPTGATLESSMGAKVDKVTGKGLSTNDYDNSEKSKVASAYQKPGTGIPKEDLSDGVKASLGNADSASQDVADIKTKIPSQATAQNQLADKDFVNSSIATATADFRGTYDSLSELQAVTADKNDYGYVVSTDQAGNTVYSRYKYDGSAWVFEYDLNNSSFTAAEWASIQSQITAALVQKLSALPTNQELGQSLSGKQDTLVSGTNIKTINNESILGSGNITAGDPNAVKYVAQTLTDAQKTQAQTNIGAAAASALSALETAIAAKYSKPSGGIPETDLASAVQSAIALARTSIQSLADYYSKTEVDALLDAVGSEQYVNVTTLPTASASTLGKIYLVGPDANGFYDRYYTSYDGSTYSWVPAGNTEINLANYATKDEFSQLQQEVTADISQLEAEVNTLMGRYYGVFGLEEELPEDASTVGFAFVGGAEPMALWEFDGNEWSDTGIEISGITGPQGVGIGKIEQTTESTASEGQNIITITLSNGDTKTFTIRNGKQGGRGPQGLQGNPGSSVDYPFTMLNNLNSTDTTKALTAAMGKLLNDTKAGVSDDSDVDLEIADGNGNILAEFADGHFRVKYFDTKAINNNTVPKVSAVGNGDFSLSDNDGNVLLLLENGHIRTKHFNSEKLPINAIKKAVFMGDSITHGVYSYWHNGGHAETDRYNGFDITNLASVSQATAYHGIHYYFGLMCDAEMVNLGKRGTGWVADTRSIGNALAVANSYNFADVDFVALCFGVNDYIQGVTIGDIDTQASGTLVGNMCATIEKILTDNPLCKVVVYSPYNTWGQVSYGGDYTSNVLYGSESTNYALGHEIGGNTLQDIIDAETEVCDHYGIQIVDLSRSNVCNRFTIKGIMVDGLHPTKASYPKLSAEIYGKGNFGA